MKVVGCKTLWEGKFIKATLISYKDRKGIVRSWEAVSRVNDNGVVVIIPVTVNNELVLIRQFRPALDNYVVEFPAGLIDPGEDIISAGKRELIEETGYTSDNIVMFQEGVISTGINTEKWNILLATGATEVTEEVLRTHPADENEDIETIRVPVDAMHEMLDTFGKNGDEIDLRIFGLWSLAMKKINAVNGMPYRQVY